MARWTVDAPTALDFDDVTALNVRLIAGTVAVLASDDRPSVVVSELSGRPLQVSHEDGVLTVAYESLSWEGLLGFLKPRKDSVAVTITVPADCPIQFGVLSASAIVSGLRRGRVGQGMSGDITLGRRHRGRGRGDDVPASSRPATSTGRSSFKSMSGGLTLAGGWLDSLDGEHDERAGHGRLRAPRRGGNVHVSTMSGDVTLRLPAGQRRAGATAVHLGRRQNRIRVTADRQGSCLACRKR